MNFILEFLIDDNLFCYVKPLYRYRDDHPIVGISKGSLFTQEIEDLLSKLDGRRYWCTLLATDFPDELKKFELILLWL
jgi:hypothetical protein